MSLSTDGQRLSNDLAREQLIDDIVILREDLMSFTKPGYELANKNFGTRAFKSKWNENFFAAMKQNMDRINSKNCIPVILKAIDKVIDRVDMLEKLVDENFNDDVSVHAMSVKRINILAYLEACTFFTVYARRLLSMIMQTEINCNSEDVTNELDDILPFNLLWLQERRAGFLMVLDLFYSGKGDLEKVVEDLPDINLNTTNIKAVESSNKNLDPNSLGFIPVVLNPIYHIGMIVAEWQHSRLRAAEAERDILQVQVVNLKLVLEKKNDAKLQQKVKYIENERLKPLYQKIAKMESKYA